jgi:uncharacterized protein YqeY
MVTLIELKKAKMAALKNKDTNAQNVMGVLIAAYQKAESDKKVKGQEMTDADMVSILNKVLKELEDEKAMYESANRTVEAANSLAQMEIVKSYMPAMMSEEEVRKVIEGLEDKSIKNVMMVFKSQYAGKVDMGLVSKVAREYQGK